MPIVRQNRQIVLACTLLGFMVATSPALSAGPPPCPSTTSQATTSPPTPRPTAQVIQAVADAGTADPTILSTLEPTNFGVTRYHLLDYYECVGSAGCYWNDLDAQTLRADAELTSLLAAHRATTPEAARAQKLALVLDIDETSLTSYCEEKREDFGYIPSMFDAWVVSPEASIHIPGTLRLFQHARAAGVSVFFITGRPGKGTPNDQTAPTARNLATAGYSDWQGLILRDLSERSLTTIAYKSLERAKLIAQGYRIILSVGDQWSDLQDPPPSPENKPRPTSRAEISVKLPNPFYYLP
jgi:predicted secreted acid phosphatase